MDYMKIIAGTIIVALLALFVNNLVSPKNKVEAKTTTLSSSNAKEILLSWGKLNYNPETINAELGKPIKIKADLTRLTGCFRSFQINELGVSKSFSEGDDILEFTPNKKGTFRFGCAMGMGNGQLIVT
jgi:plastocyanin domain-containing protein